MSFLAKYKKQLWPVGAILILVLVGGFGGAFGAYWCKYKRSNVLEDGVVKIYRSYDYGEFMDTLKASCSFRNWKSFEKAASSRELEKYVKPGRYELKKGMSNQEIIRMVANGWQNIYLLI